MKLFISSIFMLLLAPCNNSKSISKVSADNNKVEIQYECGACFGRCPVYIFSVNGNSKTATFIGKQNTKRIGTYTKPISDTELADLIKAFDDAKFSSLENEYLGPVADFPIKTITFTNNGTTKTIKDRSGSPQTLTALEKTIAAFAENDDGWKKVSDSDH